MLFSLKPLTKSGSRTELLFAALKAVVYLTLGLLKGVVCNGSPRVVYCLHVQEPLLTQQTTEHSRPPWSQGHTIVSGLS